MNPGRMLQRQLAVGLMFTLPAAAPLASDAGDLSLSAIAERAEQRQLTREAIAEGPAGILAAAVGVSSFPVTCATPLLRPAMNPDRPEAGDLDVLDQTRTLLSSVPILPGDRNTLTGDGRFLIHYPSASRSAGLPATDRDRDGIPDQVNRVAEVLVASRSHLTAFGYPDPAPDESPIEVFMIRLGRGIDGYLALRTTVTPNGPSTAPFVVLDTALASDRIGAAVMHQVAHLALRAITPASDIWWDESTASFLTLTGTGDIEAHLPALRARQEAAGHGLAADDLLLMQGTGLWQLFLAERTGDSSIVRQVWDEISRTGVDALTALGSVLERAAGLSLDDALREFAAWNLFTGRRDDGRHYAFGHALPEAIMPDIGPAVPFDLGPVEPVGPLGSVAFRLPSDGGVGALEVVLNAEGGRPGADLLVFYRDGAESPVLVPLAIDATGEAHASIPWDEALEAWILLRNSAPEEAAVARFEIRGTLNPYAPFDLAAFTAQPSGASILLEWTTASETGMLGWNVYRAIRPTGPFVRLNGVAVPAYGDGRGDTGYIFVDDDLRPGRRYYYLLEGLTQSGLTQRSHLASARPPSVR